MPAPGLKVGVAVPLFPEDEELLLAQPATRTPNSGSISATRPLETIFFSRPCTNPPREIALPRYPTRRADRSRNGGDYRQ